MKNKVSIGMLTSLTTVIPFYNTESYLYEDKKWQIETNYNSRSRFGSTEYFNHTKLIYI